MPLPETSFPKTLAKAFTFVREAGVSYRSSLFFARWRYFGKTQPNEPFVCAIRIIITKKVIRRAVQRNQQRRFLREALRLLGKTYLPTVRLRQNPPLSKGTKSLSPNLLCITFVVKGPSSFKEYAEELHSFLRSLTRQGMIG